MKFEWDEAKSQQTRSTRGFGFDDVSAVFLDPRRVTLKDARFEYGENRWITLE